MIRTDIRIVLNLILTISEGRRLDIIHQAIVLQSFLRTDFPFRNSNIYKSLVCSLSLHNSQAQLFGKRGIPGHTIPQDPN